MSDPNKSKPPKKMSASQRDEQFRKNHEAIIGKSHNPKKPHVVEVEIDGRELSALTKWCVQKGMSPSALLRHTLRLFDFTETHCIQQDAKIVFRKQDGSIYDPIAEIGGGCMGDGATDDYAALQAKMDEPSYEIFSKLVNKVVGYTVGEAGKADVLRENRAEDIEFRVMKAKKADPTCPKCKQPCRSMDAGADGTQWMCQNENCEDCDEIVAETMP